MTDLSVNCNVEEDEEKKRYDSMDDQVGVDEVDLDICSGTEVWTARHPAKTIMDSFTGVGINFSIVVTPLCKVAQGVKMSGPHGMSAEHQIL